MERKNTDQKVGRQEPELKFDVLTVVFMIIGFIVSWINMAIILDSMEIWSYLSIIFTTIIPGISIALKNRYWGYGYLIGFAIAGIPFIFIMDLFIGGYTFVTTIFIFVILWLIFWKAWRSISSIKRVSD
jgi:hypothetical protein